MNRAPNGESGWVILDIQEEVHKDIHEGIFNRSSYIVRVPADTLNYKVIIHGR